jgi:ABC-type Zn uptake system ZnuABC Zn-binding protein ZnuA
MKKIIITISTLFAWISLMMAACTGVGPAPAPTLRALAVETFLADIAQNVAGERIKIESLVPLGLDPHSFEPTPQDLARIANSEVLILNGSGLEAWAADLLETMDGNRTVIVASDGLTPRALDERAHEDDEHAGDEYDNDPHFWLDPRHVQRYVENIRDGLSAVDPAGKETYTQNAANYMRQLDTLDAWIKQQVNTIPPEQRLLVTNHESLGYFADRYGFQIIGTVIPSVSSGASPSAQELAALVEHIRETGARAIFLESGANPELAEMLASETGVKVVTEFYTHSITAADGPAPTYIKMMEENVGAIVEALKERKTRPA